MAEYAVGLTRIRFYLDTTGAMALLFAVWAAVGIGGVAVEVASGGGSVHLHLFRSSGLLDGSASTTFVVLFLGLVAAYLIHRRWGAVGVLAVLDGILVVVLVSAVLAGRVPALCGLGSYLGGLTRHARP